jgi:hypothetical protein
VGHCISQSGSKTTVNRALNRHAARGIPVGFAGRERGSITPGRARTRAPLPRDFVRRLNACRSRVGRAQEAGGAAGWPGLHRRRVIAAFSTRPPGPPPFSPLRPALSGHDAPVASEAGFSITGSGAAGAMRSEPHRSARVKPNAVALTCSDARRRRSRTRAKHRTFSGCLRAVARVVLTAARTAGDCLARVTSTPSGQPRAAARFASAARSESRRSSS